MILPSVNVALLEFVSGTLRLASGGPSNWFWYAWSSCPSIGRFQMIQKWVIPPCLGSECTQCNNQLKVIQGHFRSFSFKELLPGYDSCILSYEKNKFCSIKKWLLDINPLSANPFRTIRFGLWFTCRSGTSPRNHDWYWTD